MREGLKKLMFELDETIGTVSRLVESLDDLKVEFDILRQSMDIAAHRGQERVYYQEHHRKIRLLDDLVHYLMNDLLPASEKVHELHSSIFEMIRKPAEQESANNQAQAV